MTALDLSQYVTSTDTPELAEFKAKVRTVAKKYTDKHGWCAEVNRALKELGIEDEKQVKLGVTTSMGLQLEVKVAPSLLNGLDENAQKQKVVEVIGPLSLSGGTSVTAVISLTPETITEMKVVEVTEVTPAEPPQGWEWAYTSDEGRVLHLFQDDRHGSYSVAACGTSTYYQTQRSSRGEARRCANCESQLARGNVSARIR